VLRVIPVATDKSICFMFSLHAGIRRLAIEGIKADINAAVTIALHSVEMKDAGRIEQERIARENALKGEE
jgi:hypothetical protein